ncbi:MAG: DJ-1/PfpI family protein [Chloroflexi bacterium]|nr:DJ-1/PfpI family protein [Chloroflexota bacterium]
MRVGTLLFDDVTVTDFTGPYDVFRAARPLGVPAAVPRPLFAIFTVAEYDVVHCNGGLRVLADHRLDDHPPIDLLVVPGGFGTRREVDNARLIAWIGRVARQAQLATSVCTGALLMAKAGLLDGRPATTHWASVEWLRSAFPQVQVQTGVRYVDAGQIVSSAGVSAGIDMALHVVERLHGPAVAAQTARQLEYDYWESARRGSAAR